MKFISILKVFLFISLLVWASSASGKDFLTNQEKTQLTKLVGNHVENLYGNVNSMTRWEKGFKYATWFEEPRPEQDKMIDKHFVHLAELTGLDIVRKKEGEKSHVYLGFVKDYFQAIRKYEGFQKIFFSGMSQKEIKKKLQRDKARNAGGATNMRGSFDRKENCFFINNLLMPEKAKATLLRRQYDCLIEFQGGSDIIKKTITSNTFFKRPGKLYPLDIAFLKALYSKEITNYLGRKTANNPTNIKKAKNKLTELIVSYLIQHGKARNILIDNGGK